MAGPSFRAAPVRVRVPATSANLGPGFDALGLALSLYDDVVVQITDSGLSVDVAGEGADTVRRDKRNLVISSLLKTFDALGGKPRGLHVVCANRIPHGRGLGSSAAAIVAAVTAARHLVVGGTERLDDSQALALAADIEGHPDNVAACALGGLTVAWTDAGKARAIRLSPSPAVRPTVYVSGSSASTAKVRALLPETVPHADAAAGAGRAALLLVALTERPELLMSATKDWIHQQYRAPAMPRSASLVDRLRAAGVPAVVSGAGPTVLALGTGDELPPAPRGFERRELGVDTAGATVLALGES